MKTHAHTSKPRTLAAAIAAITVVACPPLSAAEYTLSSNLKVSAQHDDNINLEVQNQDSLYGEVVNPSAKLKVATQSWNAAIGADLRFSDFNRAGYDSDDQHITLSSEQKGERYQFSLQGRASHDTTRTSEGEDSGRFSNERRKYYSLAPSWTYQLNRNNQLTLAANLSTADYADARYTGYDNGSLYAEWGYRLAENLQVFVRANASDYESDGRTQGFAFIPVLGPAFLVDQTYITNTTSNGFQLGASYQFTENLNLYGLFGQSDTDTDYDVSDSANSCATTAGDPNWVVRGACDISDQSSSTDMIDTRLTWDQQRHTFTLSYSLQTQPSSDGYVLEYERARLNWRYQLGEHNSLDLAGVWGENNTLDQPDAALIRNTSDRDYQNLTLTYNHQLTEHWWLSANLRYRVQERQSVNDQAEGNSGFLAISYRPQTLQWSR